MKSLLRTLPIFIMGIFLAFTVVAQSGPEINPDGIIFPKLPSEPANNVSTEGQIIYNTSLARFRTFDGSAWVDLQQGGSNNSTPYKIEDLTDGDTRVQATQGLNGIADQIDFSVEGVGGGRIFKTGGGDLKLEFANLNTNNTIIGYKSGDALTSAGDNNSIFGTESGEALTLGDDNSFFGYKAGESTTLGEKNVYLGKDAGRLIDDNDENTFVGFEAGEQSSATFGRNTYIGALAGKNASSGNNNTYLGYSAGRETAGEQNVFIGNAAGLNFVNVSHRLVIDNNSVDPPLIYGEFDNEKLEINAETTIKGDFEIIDSSNPKIFLERTNSSNWDAEIELDTGGDLIFNGGVNGSASTLNELFRIDGNGYIQVQRKTQIEIASGDCDNDGELGRIVYNSNTHKLVVCNKSGGNFNWGPLN